MFVELASTVQSVGFHAALYIWVGRPGCQETLRFILALIRPLSWKGKQKINCEEICRLLSLFYFINLVKPVGLKTILLDELINAWHLDVTLMTTMNRAREQGTTTVFSIMPRLRDRSRIFVTHVKS